MGPHHKERVAVVTGAGDGIGRAIALRLGRDGVKVAVADIDGDMAGQTAELIRASGGNAKPIVVDVRDELSVASLMTATDELGPIDILVNNAGVAVAGSVTEMSLQEWQRVQDTNLRGVWLGMKFAIPRMPASGGSIVNMSSCQAILGFPGWAGYAASKGGIISLTRQAAVEYARRGVRVNSVAPGTIMTPMNERIFAESSAPEKLAAAWAKQHALGRAGQPEEVAAVVAFLASDEASFVTGACIPVDGGMSILGSLE